MLLLRSSVFNKFFSTGKTRKIFKERALLLEEFIQTTLENNKRSPLIKITIEGG